MRIIERNISIVFTLRTKFKERIRKNSRFSISLFIVFTLPINAIALIKISFTLSFISFPTHLNSIIFRLRPIIRMEPLLMSIISPFTKYPFIFFIITHLTLFPQKFAMNSWWHKHTTILLINLEDLHLKVIFLVLNFGYVYF